MGCTVPADESGSSWSSGAGAPPLPLPPPSLAPNYMLCKLTWKSTHYGIDLVFDFSITDPQLSGV